MSDHPLYSLNIKPNAYHEDAVIQCDRSALTRLRDSLNIALNEKFDGVYSRHFLDDEGEEYDVLIQLSEDL